MAPFEEGIFITQLSDTHNLLFNKFPLEFEHIIRENQERMMGRSTVESEMNSLKAQGLHLLITTQRFQEQGDMINRPDLESIYKVIRSIQGIAFFNSGPNAGAS